MEEAFYARPNVKRRFKRSRQRRRTSGSTNVIRYLLIKLRWECKTTKNILPENVIWDPEHTKDLRPSLHCDVELLNKKKKIFR